jgi:hypothetical protein
MIDGTWAECASEVGDQKALEWYNLHLAALRFPWETWPLEFYVRTHPVLTSQAEVPWRSIFSASMAAYFMGCHIRKAPPKHALKVASGSVMPISVPATCESEEYLLESTEGNI